MMNSVKIYRLVLIISILMSCLIMTYAESWEKYLQDGDLFYSEFKNEPALEDYLKAYKIAPDYYEVLVRLARTYNDLGEQFYEYRDNDSAKIMILKAIEFSENLANRYPDSSDSYAYLAMSYGNKALFEGGKEKIKLAKKIKENAEKSLELNPDQYLSYVILGIYYRHIADLGWFEKVFANTFFGDVPEGTFEQSIEMLNKALTIKPNTIVATFQLALTYKAMDNKEKEKEFLNKVLTYKQKNFRDQFAIKKAKRILKQLE